MRIIPTNIAIIIAISVDYLVFLNQDVMNYTYNYYETHRPAILGCKTICTHKCTPVHALYQSFIHQTW